MKKYSIISMSLVFLGVISSCGVSESNNEVTNIESAILKVIAADDSTYGIEGLGDIEDEDYSLGKALESDQSAVLSSISVRDSNYVWKFARRGMDVERVITVEVEDDSSALALINHQITGTFYVKQFARVWTSLDTWERGDSIRFSEKPIDMSATRRVAFRKRMDNAGEAHWKPVAMTLLSGHSGETLEIEALEWVAEDSTLVLTDFGNVFYSRRNPLLLSQMGANHMNVVVSNDVEGEGEKVTGRLGYHPRLSHPDSRSRFHFHYTETLDSGDKVYTQRIFPNRLHRRHFKGFVEVIDYRTLFDHDYEDYSSATLGFIYTTREHVRP
ncbi:MAG: hypothetical protein H8E26_05005 [FCB group bacterium]|nr:hypothetical protein [FCB group bacterium]MBL7026850.1 hypothetical protein [Candidatus Neomarinimicrobiota bacterium]MBL7121427.1 hypothetical protein [Candidatus Neomarinimicrobiota bacterium]